MTRHLPPTANLLAVVLMLAPAAVRAAGELPRRDVVVRAGTLLRIDAEPLSPGVMVVRDGRISAVGGADLSVPEGLPVIDASERVVMPGFIDAHTARGLDRTREGALDASFVRASDALNPASLEIQDARRNGITTLLVSPDDGTMFGGRGAIIHPQGLAVDSMIVKQDAALKISLVPRGGTSRMGHLATLRRTLDSMRRELKKRAEKPERERGELAPEKRALADLLAGEIPALVTCPTAADVSECFALGREYGFRVIPVLRPEAWRAAELVRANNVRVIVGPRLETWERLPDGQLKHVHLPRVLHDAGVDFALTTDPRELGAQHPWYQAARCVRAGVSREAALEAITRTPARVLGFGKRKGVLAPGADADFLVLSAPPLSGEAWVDEAYVRGARIYERASDRALDRLLRRTAEPPIMAPESDHEDPDEEIAEERKQALEADADPDGTELKQRWPASQAPEPNEDPAVLEPTPPSDRSDP